MVRERGEMRCISASSGLLQRWTGGGAASSGVRKSAHMSLALAARSSLHRGTARQMGWRYAQQQQLGITARATAAAKREYSGSRSGGGKRAAPVSPVQKHWTDLPLRRELIGGLEEMQLLEPTDVQCAAIPRLIGTKTTWCCC